MKKNKKPVIILIVILVLVVVGGFMIFRFLFGGRIKPSGEDDGEKGLSSNAKPVLFESFKIEQQGTTAVSYVVEGGETETGAFLEYYTSLERYDPSSSEEYEIKSVIRRIEGDTEFYDSLCLTLGQYKVPDWDGFVGKNPPDVLDGTSGSFNAVLSDGSTINAHGSNNFPKNFWNLYHYLVDRITIETVTGTTVENSYFSVDVPDEWKGIVKVRYDEDSLIFFVTDTKGTDVLFLIFDYNTYWYGDDKFTHLGILKKETEDSTVEYKIVARNHASLASYYDTLSDDQKKVSDSYTNCEQSVIESLKGINGYVLYPEE